MMTGDPPLDCTCGNAWNSILPPPPCPQHAFVLHGPPVNPWAPMRMAWICPRCTQVNAPHVDRCSCVVAATATRPCPDITITWGGAAAALAPSEIDVG